MSVGHSEDRRSFAVTYWGLDGVREHWTPGNRRTGKSPTEKRAFASEAEALAFIADRPHLQAQSYRGPMGVYRCSVCGEFHIGRKERRGEATNREAQAPIPASVSATPEGSQRGRSER